MNIQWFFFFIYFTQTLKAPRLTSQVYTYPEKNVGFHVAHLFKLFHICLCLLSSIYSLAPCLSLSAQLCNSS